MLMRTKIPFYKQLSLYATKIKKVVSQSPALKPTAKLLSSPSMLTKFAPVSPMIRNSSRFADKPALKPNSILAKLAINASDKKTEEAKVKPSKGTLARHTPWLDKSKAKNTPPPTDMNTEAIRLPNTTKTNLLAPAKAPTTSELLKSPSLFLRGINRGEEKDVFYCECGNPCSGENNLCENCAKLKESVEYAGYLYLKDKASQLKRYWFILLNKELYCNSPG
eukprot:TRINITY_DN1902_c0_g4_i1.p1 TRINITY_DN1902_c0_g4~~TRINITY_DN1902_c0_g4_i1.p1  ORF type:complete len:222 (-),score=70.79 TRINITY_DN1902_c0_g4_i1:205-870(-)